MKKVRKFSSLCPKLAEAVINGHFVAVEKRGISEKEISCLKEKISGGMKLKVIKEINSEYFYLWIER